MRQGNAIGNAQLRSEVGNHTDDSVFFGTKVKRPVASFCEPMRLALELSKQAIEAYASRCENAQVSVHGQNELIGVESGCNTHANRFLSHAAEPFGDFSLAQLAHHFLFNHPRKEQLTEQRLDGFVA